MTYLHKNLKGGDLRSLGNTKVVISEITNQNKFDDLFQNLFNSDRLVVMRAADAVEKLTKTHTEYLDSHKMELLQLFQSANNIELKWHLAQLIPRLIIRLKLNNEETGMVWNKLTQWAFDRAGSRIVRVNSMQGLFDIQEKLPELKKDFTDTLLKLDRETIPSIVARVKILRKKMKS